ncbi:MAG: FAD-binding oxidoreductase [Chloroflexota bacterium]
MSHRSTTRTWDVSEEAIKSLRAILQGRVLRPGDEAYDDAREGHQADHLRYPRLIVQAESTADVVAAVTFARDLDVALAVRSGGHNVYSNSNDVLLDLSRMNGVVIDPERRTARVEPGATWGAVSAAAQVHGLAVPAGDTASVGVGGLAVGGGIGWLVRKYGMTIDNIISAEVVTADGRVVVASETQNRDLFWAIRGGGGNFGIVTSFEFQAHSVPTIVGGAVIYDAADGESVLRKYAAYASAAPDELSTIVFIMHAPPAPFIPADKHGSLVIFVGVCYAGEVDEGQRVLGPLRALGTPIADITAPMPYGGIFMLTKEAEATGHLADLRSTFVDDLSDDAIRAALKHARTMTSPFGVVQIRVLGGAMARVASDATAFAHRQAGAMMTAVNIWTDPSESSRHTVWTENFLRDLVPYARGVYVNFLGDESEDRVREAYGESTYRRLRSLKAKYDPANYFNLNHDIRPLAEARQEDEDAA